MGGWVWVVAVWDLMRMIPQNSSVRIITERMCDMISGVGDYCTYEAVKGEEHVDQLNAA